MKCYKVLCKVFDDRLCSVSGHNSTELTYVPKTIIKPKILHSKLFVFDTLEHAKSAGYGTQVWGCEVVNPHKIKKIIDNAYSDTYNNVTAFWLKKKSKKSLRKVPLMKAPKGTLVCDSVKLTKFITMV